MTVADVIEYAKYGELAQLGVVKQLKCNTPAEVIEAEKQVISYINLGLIELYKIFSLRTEETTVTMTADNTIYTLTEPTLNSVYSVYDELGQLQSLNDENDANSILTPSYNTLQIQNPSAGGIMYVVYNASPTTIVWNDNLASINVAIPPAMTEALLHYIGYRAHGAMNGEINAENNTHYMRFDASCKRLKELGVVPSEDGMPSATKLEDKGFV